MMSKRAQKLNLIVFMMTSFACYQGARRGGVWLGLGPTALAVHWALFVPATPDKVRRIIVALMAGVSGFLCDTALIAANVYVVRESSRGFLPAPLCPEWILTLWLNFGFMLYLYRGVLTRRRWTASVTGAVFSFVIMGNASRMGLVFFDDPVVLKYMIIAVCWAILVPLQAWLANRIIGGTQVETQS